MLSDQEVLEQIDQWYFRRIEQAYTPEVERRILASLEHVLQSHPEIKEELGSLADKKLRIGSSREEYLKMISAHFSGSYARLEQRFSQRDLPEATDLNPLREEFEKIKAFVNKVRSGARSDMIEDDDINRAFLEVYTSQQGYTDHVFEVVESGLRAIEIVDPAYTGKLRHEILLMRGSHEAIAYLHEVAFGDLEAKKKDILT